MLCSSRLSRAAGLRTLGRRYYGAPAAVQALDPRRDKTVHLTHSRGVNVLHDPLLSKGQTPAIDATYSGKLTLVL